MPIRVPDTLPAIKVLESENIFVMTAKRAMTQDIRPLKIVILNLMPTKIETETQLLRLLGNTPLQVDVELLQMATHVSKNTSITHLNTFYKTFADIRDEKFDGMIITGAPVERMDFSEVDYWPELCDIMAWSRSNVYSTMHICWGAQAGLYYHYGIEKHLLPQKMFGIFPQKLCDEYNFLTNGFDEIHMTPHSRHTAIDEEQLKRAKELEVLSCSEVSGTNICATADFRQIFILGHLEYGVETLAQEYFRDLNQHKPIQIPVNYFPDDDPSRPPVLTWRSHANLLYRNWLNYVYQMTPYAIETIELIQEPIGTSGKDAHGYAHAFRK